MKCFLLIVCVMCFAGPACAVEGPVYERHRQHGGGYGGHYGGGGFYGQPFYGGYFYQPPIYGSWYARPYPTHLDYFRLRGTSMVNHPCMEVMPAPPEVIPAE
jgi:hypothetical protein